MDRNDGPVVGLRQLQLIIGAMVAGVVVFTGVVVVLGPRIAREDGGLDVLFPVLCLTAAGLTVVSLAIPRMMARRGRQDRLDFPDEPDPERWLKKFFAPATLISSAAAESLGLFANVVYLVTANPLALVVTGISFLLLAFRFPTQAGAETFRSLLQPDPLG